MTSYHEDRALYVDLNGTLIATDLLWESLIAFTSVMASNGTRQSEGSREGGGTRRRVLPSASSASATAGRTFRAGTVPRPHCWPAMPELKA
jgi:hypothetical protein